MNKKDLVNGSVVETRGLERYLFVDGTLFDLKDLGSFNHIDDYNEDLTYSCDSNFDIMKVHNEPYNCVGAKNFSLREVVRDNKWTWIRPEQPKLSKEAIVILKCLPKEYKYITRDCDNEIWLHRDEPILKKDVTGKIFWTSKTNEYFEFFDYLFRNFDLCVCYNISDLIGDNNE